MDLIFLRGLAAEVRVGVPDWERARPQTLNFSIELAIDAAVAAVDDDLAATIDYAAVAAHLRAFLAQGEYRLLETLAERLAAELQREFGAPGIVIEVDKGAIVDGVQAAGVRIARGCLT